MTDTNNVTAASDAGNLKRSIQMKAFVTKDLIRKCIGENREIPVGQIVGQIFDVKEKNGTLPDGSAKMSLLAIGEFEAVNYGSGEVFESATAYLPAYYLEVVKSMMEKSQATSIVIGVEICLAPTGKTIPYAYEIKNLARRRPDNPMSQLKADLAKAGRLRLPPPVIDAAMIEGEQRDIPALPAPAPAPGPNESEYDPAVPTPGLNETEHDPVLDLEPAKKAAGGKK